MEKIIYVSDSFFLSLVGRCDLVSIIEKGKISDLITMNNKSYCLAGSVGTGAGGYERFSAYEAIPYKNYKAKKIPLRYGDHFKEVNAGNRERSYDGLLLQFKLKDFVLAGGVEILPIGPHPVYKIPKLKLKQEAIVKHSDLIKPFVSRKDFDKWLNKLTGKIKYQYRAVDDEGKFINEWNFKKV